jgi:hypothetical protein
MKTVGFVDGLREDGRLEERVLRIEDDGPPLGRCDVLVACDGIPLCRVIARESRLDVAEKFNAPKHCGFSYLPYRSIARGVPHDFRFFAMPKYQEIQGSPCRVTMKRENTEPYDLKRVVATVRAELGAMNVARTEAERVAGEDAVRQAEREAAEVGLARAERLG